MGHQQEWSWLAGSEHCLGICSRQKTSMLQLGDFGSEVTKDGERYMPVDMKEQWNNVAINIAPWMSVTAEVSGKPYLSEFFFKKIWRRILKRSCFCFFSVYGAKDSSVNNDRFHDSPEGVWKLDGYMIYPKKRSNKWLFYKGMHFYLRLLVIGELNWGGAGWRR